MAGRYKAYPKYKESELEWLGNVPEHWEVEYSKWLFQERNNKAKATDEMLTASQKYGVIPQKMFMKLEQQKVVQVQKGHGILKKVLEDDFVISMRSFQGGIEFCSYNGAVSSAYVPLEPKKRELSCFFKYLFKSKPFIQALQATSNLVRDGQALRYNNFIQVRLPVPTSEEAESISNFLDHEITKIDTLIAKQEKLIELLKEKRQAVFSHAVTKGLNPNAPMRDSGVEWLGEVPEHWVIKSYRHACKIYRGKFGHRPRNDPAFYDGEYPFIQTGDVARAGKYIKDYKQTLNDKGIGVSQMFPTGTLMMAIAANIGDTAILGFEAYAPDSVVGFKPNYDIDLEFLRYSFMAALPALEQTSTQSTQANLNVDRIGAVQASFPSTSEQKEIVTYLDSLLDRYDNIELKSKNSIELMKERKTALISAAVTGKIDVRDWNF